MLIVDFNQTLISTLMSQLNRGNQELSEDLIRHMVLATLLSYKRKFGREFGELVIACDDKNYWRKSFFPYYKAGRKKAREKSDLDWNLIFKCLNKIRDEVREIFPYRVIQVEHAEADDIIATLCKHTPTKKIGLIEDVEPVLIVSGDKDFLQLQKYPHVKQYSPIFKKFLYTDSPELTLKEHIITGDFGDGVPNILCEDSRITDGKRQTGITEKKLQEWLKLQPEQFCDETQLKYYERNKRLIDLSYIPEDIESQVLEQYAAPITGHRSKLFNYFMLNGLKLLMADISEF